MLVHWITWNTWSSGQDKPMMLVGPGIHKKPKWYIYKKYDINSSWEGLIIYTCIIIKMRYWQEGMGRDRFKDGLTFDTKGILCSTAMTAENVY